MYLWLMVARFPSHGRCSEWGERLLLLSGSDRCPGDGWVWVAVLCGGVRSLEGLKEAPSDQVCPLND